MKTISATEAKQRFGELLDTAQAEPVAIQKNGRDVAYVVSKQEFEKRKSGDIDPRVIELHEEGIRDFEGSYRKLAE